MSVLIGIPEPTTAHLGIDRLGEQCRVHPTVSVMRWGERERVLQLGDRVSIYAYVRLVLGDVDASADVGLNVGSGTIINVGAYLSGEGGLTIGGDVLIGADVKLLSAGHEIDGGDEIIARNRITRAPIVIEDGAWVGAGAIVLEGVRIGRGAVVAAGAVVRTDVPDGMIAAGIPARVVRARRRGEVDAGLNISMPDHIKRESIWRRWLRGNRTEDR